MVEEPDASVEAPRPSNRTSGSAIEVVENEADSPQRPVSWSCPGKGSPKSMIAEPRRPPLRFWSEVDMLSEATDVERSRRDDEAVSEGGS